MLQRLISTWKWKDLIRNLVLRNLRIRYKGSALGFVWTMLNPLLMMLIYFVFVTLLRTGIDLPELLVGILVWQFFTMCINDSIHAITGSPSLIKRTSFPKLTFPLSMVLANLVNFLLSLVVLAVFLVLYAGVFNPAYPLRIDWALLLLPLVVALQIALILGLACVFSALNVYFRDVEHIISVGLLAWFFLTPVMYTIQMVESRAGPALFNLYLLNPMASLVTLYRRLFLGSPLPGGIAFYVSVSLAPIILVVGTAVFLKKEPFFADEM